jgi:hypothetical protein
MFLSFKSETRYLNQFILLHIWFVNLDLPADHQRGTRLAEPDRVVGRRQRENEAGTYRLDIEGGAVLHTELCLHLGRGGRKGMVGRRGRHHDQVEVIAAHPGAFERAPGRRRREVRGQLALCGDAPLGDAGALANPCVGGVEPPRQLVIGQDPLGKVGPAPGDLRAQGHAGVTTMLPVAASAPRC